MLYWPEADPNCGTGKYSLVNMLLALSSVDPNFGGQASADVLVELFTYFPTGDVLNASSAYSPDQGLLGPGEPLPGTLQLVANRSLIAWYSSQAIWITLPLGEGFVVDTNVSVFSVLTWRVATNDAILWTGDFVQVWHSLGRSRRGR